VIVWGLFASIAFGAAVGLSAARTWLAMRAAEQRYPPSGKFLEVMGTRLHYVDRGSGPSVVLLHGNPGFVEDYLLTVVPDLAASFRVVAIDRPGHGYSSRSAGSGMPMERQTTIVHTAVVELGLARPILVGHSWSGSIVLRYALEYPDEVSGVVLLGAMTHPVPAGSPGRARLFTSRIGPIARWLVSSWTGRAEIRSNLRQAYAPDAVRADHGAVAEAMWSRPGQMRAVAEDQLSIESSLRRLVLRYGELTSPMVFVVGDADPWCRPEVHVEPLATAVPHMRTVTLGATGHELPHTRPIAVLDAIRSLAVYPDDTGEPRS
jgi:pimeloyl-ACP methyl ester carboxylesterase